MRSAGVMAGVVMAGAVVLAAWPALTRAGVEGGTKAEHAIAVCDIVHVVERLMDSERYKPARDEAGTASEAALVEFRNRLQAAEERLRGMQEGDPNLEAARREFQIAQMQFQRRGQELTQQMDTLTARQLTEAYGVATASAAAVAEQMGYAYVVASRPTGEALDAPDVASVVRAMLARPVLRMPEGVDITADVKADLKID